jgi:hypothetical protein
MTSDSVEKGTSFRCSTILLQSLKSTGNIEISDVDEPGHQA